MKVVVLTSFYEADSGYSVVAVTENILRMMVDHGYNPVVVVDKNFRSASRFWQPHNLDLRLAVSGTMTREELLQVLDEHASDADVVITQDVFLFGWFSEWQHACLEFAQSHPGQLWLNYLHSVPTEYVVTPPGYLIYPNSVEVGKVYRNYRLHGKENKVQINRSAHSVDPYQVYGCSEEARVLADAANLLDSDVSIVYPTRMNRSKQVHKIVSLVRGILDCGYSASLLVCDWQSGGSEFQGYIKELLDMARELDMSQSLTFSSMVDDRFTHFVPRPTVMQLLNLSNVYVHPSTIETYSIATHEAILAGLMVVCNQDQPVAREMFHDFATMYMDFGEDRVYSPDERSFWKDESLRLITKLRSNDALWARTRIRKSYRPEAQWRDFEWLLYLEPLQ